MLNFVPALKQQFKELINGKSQINRDQKSSLLFLKRRDQSQKFRIKLVKNWQKTLQRHWYLLYWIQKKLGDCENIHSVNPFYLLVNHANGYIEQKMDINTWFLMILLMKTKSY